MSDYPHKSNPATIKQDIFDLLRRLKVGCGAWLGKRTRNIPS
jgi:hypothetical protein